MIDPAAGHALFIGGIHSFYEITFRFKFIPVHKIDQVLGQIFKGKKNMEGVNTAFMMPPISSGWNVILNSQVTGLCMFPMMSMLPVSGSFKVLQYLKSM
ncbi:MAG: hypothetical protein MZV70_15330 [Desulfobacterales bacterium]|nr:hypothetical protein [Desulfobacterales bacterium]